MKKMSATCEKCQQPLAPDATDLICTGCGVRYHYQPVCPDCHQPLEQLRSCGATDYFCNHGHGLVSKHRLTYRIVPA
ncbi:zinc ribbon domain-containing protein [Pantoea allii]